MVKRLRRNRGNMHIRSLARETRISSDAFILPIFITDGEGIEEEITSLEGCFRFSIDRVHTEIDRALGAGVQKFILFGVPRDKDDIGSGAYSEIGIIQRAVKHLRQRYAESIYIITDVCMCEYTSHGHCGIINGNDVENDATLTYLERIAVSHASAGADMIAPSDMMDGRVHSIRQALDNAGFINVPIMAYSVKYCSAFYGPFRDAANSSPKFGDRQTYQMDYHNRREALREALLDVDEGADMIIIKPALSYLDVISLVSQGVNAPIVAYSVSGEYAMIKLAAKAGFIDEYKIMCETAISIFRAGADALITYYAKELAIAAKMGDIG